MKHLLIPVMASLLCYGCIMAQNSHKYENVMNDVNSTKIENLNAKAPLIGVVPTGTDQTTLKHSYSNAVLRAGGIPVVLSADTATSYIKEVVSKLDGLLLTGGADIKPEYYGEDNLPELEAVNDVRDVLEFKALQFAVNRNIPVFGICRGFQLINVAFGGTMYQDVPTQIGKEICHRSEAGEAPAMHEITISKNSQLYKVLGKEKLIVNSFHHQALKDIGKGINVTATAPDGVVEGIDFYPNYRIMAVQWHPEAFNGENEDMNKLLSFFIDEARTYMTAKRVHENALSVDTHTDGPLGFDRGFKLGERGNNCVNVPKMQEGLLDAQFLAAFVSSSKREMKDGKPVSVVRPLNKETFDECNAKVLQLIKATKEQVAKYSDVCALAANEQEAMENKLHGKKSIFIGVENGIGIGEDLSRIREYKELGVRYVTLTHSYDNQICNSSTHTADGTKGLTAFGKKVVKEMNKLGVVIDLSHASEGTFWDVMALSKAPVMCSHSGARALCGHDRNLTDDQLRALAKNGGVVQTVALGSYLVNSSKGKATLQDFIQHVDHMVKVAGIDHVGIGTDFDGGGGVEGLRGDNDMVNITMALLQKGYSEEDLIKLWGGNFFRVMREVENVAQ